MVDFPFTGAGRVNERHGGGVEEGADDLFQEFVAMGFPPADATLLSEYFTGKTIEEVFRILSPGGSGGTESSDLIDEEQMKALASLLAELLENGETAPIDELLDPDTAETEDKEALRASLGERLYGQSDVMNINNLEQILIEAGIGPAEAKSLSQELAAELQNMPPEDATESVLEVLMMAS